MRTVKFSLDENEFRTLTEQATRLGVHRSDLIRTKLTEQKQPQRTAGAKPTVAQYLDIVSAVQKRMGNSIAPSQVEQCVAVAIQCLYA
jgi:hypothetical protein